MNDQPVLFSRAAASCRLTLNREDKCHAINEEMIESLDHYLNEIENDTALRLVELTATGDKFFCAGGDIKSWSAYSPLDMGRKWIKRGNDVFNRLRNLPQLTVANLNGHTIGGGIELALCCDIRIARPHAKFSNPEVMLGKRLTAQEAQAANLIDEVVEKEQVESWMANQLAQLEKCGPVALAHIKQLILTLENKHADYSHQLLAGLMSATQDCQQATRAFAEKAGVSFHNQ
ncbi:TPA: enoyl-CoA hydratase/isomerase family protein [Escherichia coli]|nr:enoyl-CoA hydratase/isomerase family protein [Escherichia coli]